MTDASAPAGWYPDGSGQLRWWDGSQWTVHVASIPADPPTPAATPTRAQQRAQKKSAKAATRAAAADAQRVALEAKQAKAETRAREATAAEAARRHARAEETARAMINALPPARTRAERELREAFLATGGADLTLTEFSLWGNQWPNTEVAGEAYHRDSLAALYRAPGRSAGVEFFSRAHLVPELMIDHPEAVRVDVEGRTVGYLAQADGRKYRAALSNLVVRGRAPTARTRVWATNDDGTWRGRVTVALDEPETLVPANEHPGQPAVEIPDGRAVKVTGVEAHIDDLMRMMKHGGRTGVWVTLHAVNRQTRRTEKRVVEARIDGRAVGALTPATSAGILSVVDRADALGRSVVARGYLTGNSLDVGLSLSLARTEDLDEEWITENLTPQP